MLEEVKKLEPFWDGWIVTEMIGEGHYGETYKLEKEEYGIKTESVLKHIKIPGSQAMIKHQKSQGLSDKEIYTFFKNVAENLLQNIMRVSEIKEARIVQYSGRKVVTDEGNLGWDVFLRMPKLTNLTDYVKENGITDKTALKMGSEICRALEACSKDEFVHCDIKPENIFVNEEGRFLLGDLGIAKAFVDTMRYEKKGTMLFVSPELYRGHKYDQKTDTYSLGLVLYRLFNDNRDPFMPPSPEPIYLNDVETSRVKRIGGEEPEKPKNAEGRAAEIILKAIANDRAQRYASPVVMRIEIESLIGKLESESVIITKEDKLPTAEDFDELAPDQAAVEAEAMAETTEDVLMPGTGELASGTGELAPDTGELAPDTGELVPDTGELMPDTGELMPDTGELMPDTGELMPDMGELAPDDTVLMPDVGAEFMSDSSEEYGELAPEEDYGELVPDGYEELKPDISAEPEEQADAEQTEPPKERPKLFLDDDEDEDGPALYANVEDEVELDPEYVAQVAEETNNDKKKKKKKKKGGLFGLGKKQEEKEEEPEEDIPENANIWEAKYGSTSDYEEENGKKQKNKDPFGFNMGW